MNNLSLLFLMLFYYFFGLCVKQLQWDGQWLQFWTLRPQWRNFSKKFQRYPSRNSSRKSLAIAVFSFSTDSGSTLNIEVPNIQLSTFITFLNAKIKIFKMTWKAHGYLSFSRRIEWRLNFFNRTSASRSKERFSKKTLITFLNAKIEIFPIILKNTGSPQFFVLNRMAFKFFQSDVGKLVKRAFFDKHS